MTSRSRVREWLDAHPAPPRQARPKGVELSYSQVRAYLNCPWLYKLVYLDRRRAPLHPRAALGLSIHRALEAFHREDASDLARLLELYEEAWVHAGFASAVEQMEWHKKGQAVLRSYFKAETERRSEVLGVEKDFLFPLEPHVIRGTIDRVDRRPDGEVEIIDYKTHLEVATEAAAAEDLQLIMYGLGAERSLGLDPKWLTLYYVAAGRKVSVPYDRARAEEVLELLARVGDLIALSPAMKPDVSFCPRCDMRRLCAHSTARD